MARYSGPRLKIVRRLGAQLPGLIRTEGDLKRPYAPGQHGPNKRGKLSDYGLRLREKQKLRFNYCVSEKQLRRYVAKASAAKGNTGLLLLASLETRLDSVVFRAGYAKTILAARQMVRHGHVMVNGKKVDIPSYALRSGDEITPKATSKMKEQIATNRQDPSNLAMPSYLALGDDQVQVKMISKPAREDIPVILNEQLIVEYYSGK